MIRPRTIAIVTGVGGLGVALLAVVAGVVPAVLAVVATDVVVLAFAVLTALVGLLVLVGSPTPTHDVELPTPRTPGSSLADVPDRTPTARAIDDSLERPALDETQYQYRHRMSARGTARKTVRQAAVDVLATRHDVTPEAAAERVEDGTWTEDPRAATFLGSDVELPRRIRVFDWLFGIRYQRGLEAAVSEVNRLAEEDEYR